MEGELGDFGMRLLDSVKMADENKPGEAAAEKLSEDQPNKASEVKATLVFSMRKCPTETVVVYLDRAEVTRSLKAEVKFGENEIIVKDLSGCIDKDSIRVEGRGPATISEVAFQTKYLTPDEEVQQTSRSDELQKKLNHCHKRKKILNTKTTRLKKQRSVLDGFADSVTKSSTSDKDNASGLALNSDTLQGMVGFFDLYDKQAARLDDSIHQISEDIERVDREMEAVQKELNELNIGKDPKEYKELSVLLDCTDEAEVELYIAYVVSKAKWSPKYDIRVFSNEGQMKILYYGVIQQSTGEDWDEARVCLSTAMPSVGGTVPDLGTQKLGFKQRTVQQLLQNDLDLSLARNARAFSSIRKGKRRPQSTVFPSNADLQYSASKSADEALGSLDIDKWFKQESSKEEIKDLPLEETTRRRSMGFGRRSAKRVSRSSSFQAAPEQLLAQPAFAGARSRQSAASDTARRLLSDDLESSSLEPADDLAENGEFQLVAHEVKESITTTMYEIARRSTIPSDNVGHKVSVAIIDLQPTFEYECVPKKSAHAYLKAKVKNTSPYALLTGPTNIFLDNNFIAKAELKAVSPSEDFTCSLGVDPAVKVTYKPLHKYREQTGLISKTVSTTYKQVIEVKNTHKDLVKILVIDQVPLSTEEKIRVQLVEPVIKHPEKYDPSKPIRMNKMNNVEWEVEIPAGQFTELTLKYAVDHPVSEEVESNVIHYTANHSSSEA